MNCFNKKLMKTVIISAWWWNLIAFDQNFQSNVSCFSFRLVTYTFVIYNATNFVQFCNYQQHFYHSSVSGNSIMVKLQQVLTALNNGITSPHNLVPGDDCRRRWNLRKTATFPSWWPKRRTRVGPSPCCRSTPASSAHRPTPSDVCATGSPTSTTSRWASWSSFCSVPSPSRLKTPSPIPGMLSNKKKEVTLVESRNGEILSFPKKTFLYCFFLKNMFFRFFFNFSSKSSLFIWLFISTWKSALRSKSVFTSQKCTFAKKLHS